MLHIDIPINVAILSLVLLFSSGANPRMRDGFWNAIYGTAIVASGFVMYYGRTEAAYALAAFFLVFVVVPLGLLAAASWYDAFEQSGMAARLFRLAGILHPAAGWRAQAMFTTALAQPSIQEKCAALEHLEGDISGDISKELKAAMRIHRLRLLHDWEGLLAIPEPSGEPSEALSQWAMSRLQALAGLGRINEAADWYFSKMQHCDLKVPMEQILFPLLVFTGKYQMVDALVQSQRRDGKRDDEAERWVANLARLVAGQEAARAALEALIATVSDPLQRSLMQRRLETPLPDINSLTTEHSEAIDRLANDYLAKAAARLPLQKPHVTFTLLAIIGAAYVLQVALGRNGMQARLIDAAGMYPPAVLNGEWWRSITAPFLHAGPFHLIANGSALLMLGAAAEQHFGSRRMLAIYGLGGIVSSIVVCWAMTAGYIRENTLVGASGAILALFGAFACHQINEWRKEGPARKWATLKPIGVGIAWQAFYDTIMPNVSSTAHISGFFAGFAVGAIFILSRR